MKMYWLVWLMFVCSILPEATFNGIEETAANAYLIRNKVVICYVTIWSVSRPDRGQFTVENIDPTLCTHIAFGHSRLNDTGDNIRIDESWTELLGNKSDGTVSMLKSKNPNVKVLVSVGGWLEGSIKFSQMVANPKRRERFVNNSIRFIKENGMDGLDLVWQYPSKRGGTPRDKENYIHLLKEFRVAMDEHNLTLTACVGSSKDTIDYGYEVSKISEYLDFMFVYAYDFHGWWSRITGPNSGLKGPDFLNVEYAVKYLLKLGADHNKLILGVPVFARNYILNDSKSFDQNAPKYGQKFVGQGFQGPYSEEEGFLSYNEVCLFLKNSSQKWDVYWDEESDTTMAVSGEKMISYDDIQSIRFKVRFALENNLGGIFVYAIDDDDFQGDCGEEYPILHTINNELLKYDYEVFEGDTNVLASEINSVGCKTYYIFSAFVLMLLIHLLCG